MLKPRQRARRLVRSFGVDHEGHAQLLRLYGKFWGDGVMEIRDWDVKGVDE